MRVSVLSCFSRVGLFRDPMDLACQGPLSMKFSRQEYWSGFPPPGDLPVPGTEPVSPTAPALVDSSSTTESPGKPRDLKEHTYIDIDT